MTALERRSPGLLGLILLGLILILAVALRAPGITTSRTFGDEGARVAAAVPIAEGQAPYVDVINFGPPGAVLFNALALGLFGESVLAVRSTYLLVSILSLLLVFSIGRNTYGPGAGLLAALFFAAAPDEVYYSYRAMTEPLMMLLVLAALAVATLRPPGRAFPRFAAAGALAFCAGLVKQPGVLVGLIVAVASLLAFVRSKETDVLKARLSGLAAGFLAALGAWSAYMLLGGDWWQWFREMTTYGGLTTAELHRLFDLPGPANLEKWTAFFDYAARRPYMVFGLLGLALPFQAAFRFTALRISAGVMTLFALLFLPLTYDCTGLSHYLLLFEPFWILLSAGALQTLFSSITTVERPARTGAIVGKTLLALVLSALLLASGRAQWSSLDFARLKRESLRDLSVERAIAAEAAQFEEILVLANPIYYFHTGKRPPGWPLDYFVVYQLVIGQAKGDALDEIVLDLLRKPDLLVLDPKRLEIVESVLENVEAPRLELVPHSQGDLWPRLYSVLKVPEPFEDRPDDAPR